MTKPQNDYQSSDFETVRKAELAELQADENNLAALCFSGGGIRSATFNLGVLQGLARQGLLDKFDYLSTVSGGGYIGSWLSAWIHREGQKKGADGQKLGPEAGLRGVIRQLQLDVVPPDAQEPAPIRHLRGYGNYLTPQKGALSTDTWTSVMIYLRNLLLSWLYLVPLLMALLTLPRIALAWLNTQGATNGLALAGGAFATLAMAYIGFFLPSVRPREDHAGREWQEKLNTEGNFTFGCLSLFLLSAWSFTLWAVTHPGDKLEAVKIALWAGYLPSGLKLYVLGALLPFAALGLVYFVFRLRGRGAANLTDTKFGVGDFLLGLLGIVVAGAVVGGLMYAAALALTGRTAQFHTCFGAPAVMLIYIAGGTVFAGINSRGALGAADQEWWARAGAWMLKAAVGWCALCGVAVYGPDWMEQLKPLTLGDWTGKLTLISGVVSGLIAVLGGFSSKVPATEEEQQASWRNKLATLAVQIAAVLFVVFIFVLLAKLNAQIVGWFRDARPLASWVTLDNHEVLHWLFFGVGAFLAGLGFGFCININTFSLHYYYQFRLSRAYTGASLPEAALEGDKFTHFPYHNRIYFKDLRGQKPFHVINMALNYAGGKRLDWQDRKAESFTVSPLHAGGRWLGADEKGGYCPVADYTREKGISLQTAMAISGAAVSPNMGYMMTSPVLRFLLTLFNVRLGVWLGNPAHPDKTYKENSPPNAAAPIILEALGMTNDKSPYVYLSDGGHFENLGLYEMVLRRCRLIVVSDAAADPKYQSDCLATALRLIRQDLGISIKMRGMEHLGKKEARGGTYCAIGAIPYADKEEGLLIYLKPSVRGDEPVDVGYYHAAHSDFPQQTTADQFFGEAQFESYRMLGLHVIRQIAKMKDKGPSKTLAEFYARACAHARVSP